ncbi:uncharacterized protein LOC108668096 [Hyalella azteca]|uniref:Uncharacterized protein LOC108668096 n=1 Tax=Hyalella azteca TaxID=294128 RepID=A0A8B7NAX3_HYAAZ|nr:uncharacterized protein LOC108668096 [Hyalella azteca]
MMVQLHCLCLNVQISIEAKTADIKDLPLHFPHQLPDCPDDEFFQKGVLVVRLDLGGVSSEISELVEQQPLSGGWVLHHCLSCNFYTHAVHTSSSTHAASPALLSGAAIEAQKASDRYSGLFHLVLPPSSPDPASSHTPPAADKTHMPPLSTTLLPLQLQRQLTHYTKQLESLCEERIRCYKEQQLKLLDQDIERAKHDSYVLLALLMRLDKINIRRPSQSAGDLDAHRRRSLGTTALEPALPSVTTHQASFSLRPPTAPGLDAATIAATGLDSPGVDVASPLSRSVAMDIPLSALHSGADSEDEFRNVELFDFSDEESDRCPPPLSSPPHSPSTHEDDYLYTEQEAAEYLAAEAAEREANRIEAMSAAGIPSLAQSVPIDVPNMGQPLPIRRPRSNVVRPPCRSPSEICARILQLSATYSAQTTSHGHLFERRPSALSRTLRE